MLVKILESQSDKTRCYIARQTDERVTNTSRNQCCAAKLKATPTNETMAKGTCEAEVSTYLFKIALCMHSASQCVYALPVALHHSPTLTFFLHVLAEFIGRWMHAHNFGDVRKPTCASPKRRSTDPTRDSRRSMIATLTP